MSNRLSNYT